MTDLEKHQETIMGWARAVESCDYNKALAILENYKSGALNIDDSLLHHVDWLLETTSEWSKIPVPSGQAKVHQPSRCSFCGHCEDDQLKLVAGPGVFICSKCVRICANVLGFKI